MASTARLSLLLAAIDFCHSTLLHVRFQQLAQVRTIAYSLLLDYASGTTYLFTYVILSSLLVPLVAEDAPVCPGPAQTV